MTSQELKLRQEQLTQAIYEHARALGLSNERVEPITDGVADTEAYLASQPRVMWVLKEPYDDFHDGKPCGGGWSIPEDCFGKADAWTSRSWQPIIYVMYALRHGLTYMDMDYIRNDRSMADVLKQIAYVNLSKMPGYTLSSYGRIQELYDLWRPVVMRQIELYDPEMIVCGNTFSYIAPDLEDCELLASYDGMVNAYRWGKRLVLSAFHPNCKKSRERYVNTLLQAMRAHPPIGNL